MGGVATDTIVGGALPGSHVFLVTYSGDSTYAKNTAYLVSVFGFPAATVSDASTTITDPRVLDDVAVGIAAMSAAKTTDKVKNPAT